MTSTRRSPVDPIACGLALGLALAASACGGERKAVQLLELGRDLFVPVDPASLASGVDPGSVTPTGARDLELAYDRMPIVADGRELTALVAYTTPQLLASGTAFRTMSVTQTLQLILDDPELDAIAINPESHPVGPPFLDEGAIARYLSAHERQEDRPWAVEVRG